MRCTLLRRWNIRIKCTEVPLLNLIFLAVGDVWAVVGEHGGGQGKLPKVILALEESCICRKAM